LAGPLRDAMDVKKIYGVLIEAVKQYVRDPLRFKLP